jgi:hypothetical protein
VALGNWFWVIPPNVVCGTCNHGILSVLDTKLKDHPFVSLIRTLADVSGRAGQPPSAGASNMRLRRDEQGNLHIETNHLRHVSKGEEVVSASPQWTNFGPRQRRDTARALLKVGLGAMWLAHGPEETSHGRYDHVRDAIRDVGRVPLQYGFGNARLPTHALNLIVIAAKPRPHMRVGLSYFGIEFWVQTDGYREQARPEFLAKEIDVEFLDGDLAGRGTRERRHGVKQWLTVRSEPRLAKALANYCPEQQRRNDGVTLAAMPYRSLCSRGRAV